MSFFSKRFGKESKQPKTMNALDVLDLIRAGEFDAAVEARAEEIKAKKDAEAHYQTEEQRFEEMRNLIARFRLMGDEGFAEVVNRGRQVVKDYGCEGAIFARYPFWRNAVAEELALRALLKKELHEHVSWAELLKGDLELKAAVLANYVAKMKGKA